MMEPAFTIGIEEEYLLVNKKTRDLVAEPPSDMLTACQNAIPGMVHPEFLKAQIEVATGVCTTVKDAHTELTEMRAIIARIAAGYGLAIIAASTHPFSEWTHQVHTDADRYNQLAQDMQAVARRLLICGMHVHVGIDDDDLRIDLLNQASYFLPHLLALSTSSPYWRGEDTGLNSYRLSVFDELPRTGLPEKFETFRDYQRHIDILASVGVIPDASMIWWDLRPSCKFPTLEMRIADVCTTRQDAAAIAALFQCVLRMLWRLRRSNQRWRHYAAMLVNENRWRAKRYGIDEGMIDFGKAQMVPFGELLDELLDLIVEDAEALGCVAEVGQVRQILQRGTSAHRQRQAYQSAIDGGASHAQALTAVVDWLIKETTEGL